MVCGRSGLWGSVAVLLVGTCFAAQPGWRMIGVLTQTWSGGGWSDSYRTTHTYVGNDNDRATGYLSESWSAGWVPSMQAANTYDGQGRLVSALYRSWQGSTWVDATRTTYGHDGSGNQVEWVSESWVTNAWVQTWRQTTSYDAGGHALEVLGHQWQNDAWAVSAQTTYEYDGLGNMSVARTYSYQDPSWVQTGYTTCDYDAANRETQRITYGWRDTAWVPVSLAASSHDANGNLAQIIQYARQGDGWVEQSRTTYTWEQFSAAVHRARVLRHRATQGSAGFAYNLAGRVVAVLPAPDQPSAHVVSMPFVVTGRHELSSHQVTALP